MRSVGKQAHDEGGKYPVNEIGEEMAEVRMREPNSRQANVARCLRPNFPRHCEELATIAKQFALKRRSNPSIRHAARWIASLALAMTASFVMAEQRCECPGQARAFRHSRIVAAKCYA
jgi:hypothetical protein